MSQFEDSGAAGFVPEPEHVAKTFRNHVDNFADTSGEVAYQQLQNEESIRRQYSGRVLFELLQNGLDRADRRVTVGVREIDWALADRALVVGNDGTPICVDPEYDYVRPPETRDARRPDFNALCSLHTSNKLPEESVGNKGIGFRSVFWLGDFVRVWSRFADDPGWWGLELHSPLDQDTWMRRRDVPAVRAGHRTYLDSDLPINEDDRRPSFHFPLPLDAERPPTPSDVEPLSTVVVVPIREDRWTELQDSVDAIQEGHLNFVGLFEDRRDLTVTVDTPRVSFIEQTWPETDEPGQSDRHRSEAPEKVADVVKQSEDAAEPSADAAGETVEDGHTTDATGTGGRSIYHWASPELAPLAEEAEHELSTPGAAVAWPAPDDAATGSQSEPRVYGYLPTLIDSPFGVDLQGDFQLRTDRTGLRLDDEQIGQYNAELLKVAAELHLYAVLGNVGLSRERIEWEWIEPDEVDVAPNDPAADLPREDLWAFLDPDTADTEAGGVVAGHLESLLFADSGSTSPERYRHWAALATEFFDTQERWPLQTYRDFWRASGGWVDRVATYGSNTNYWRKRAAAMGDALRQEQGDVVPVTATKELPPGEAVPSVPLPERSEDNQLGGRSARHTRRLFLRRSDDTDLNLPRALREANRAVTSFDFPAGFDNEPPQPLGADQFNRWDVLRELRQLPHDLEDWSFEPLAADEDRATDLQRELLRFAMDLYALESRGGNVSPAGSDKYGPGWRALRNSGYSDNARRAGRSIATLFLPTTRDDWEPARQLTLDDIDTERLPAPHNGVDLDEFLEFLGVTPAPPEDGVPLTLVEGGETDVSAAVPPAIIAAGSQWSPLRLGRGPDAGEDGDGSAWLRSLDAAWDWLGPLIEAERAERDASEDGGRLPLDLLSQLRDHAWVPVGEGEEEVDPPAVVDDPPRCIPPTEVTLVSRQQRQFPAVLWSIATESQIESELLTALGAVPGTDVDSLGKENATPARRLLDQLRELTDPRLAAVEENPHTRQALTRLVDRLLNTVAREHDPGDEEPSVPLLVYQGTDDKRALSDRPLEWTDSDADVWIPTETAEREQMRRFFSEAPLAAATIGRNTLAGYAPLADCELEITRHVYPAHKGSEEGAVVTELEDTLGRIIPHLLALAESTNRVDVDPASTADRWRSRVVRYVDDAWVEFEVTLRDETRRSDPQFKGGHNHALFLQDDPPTVVFDTPRDRDGPPPLDEFGEPLAKLLLADSGGGVGPSFAHALGAFNSGGLERVERILRKHDAMPLVDAYERHLRQLDQAEYEALQQRVRVALRDLGLEVRDSWTRLSHLAPDDLDASEASRELTSHEVQEALRAIDLSEEQEPFRPQFSCADSHWSVWEDWREEWDERLVPFLEELFEKHADLVVAGDEVAEQLDEFVRTTACERVAFEPEVAVQWWLETEPFGASIPREEFPAPEDLEEQLLEFSPRYEPVEDVITVSDTDIRRPEVERAEPSESESGVVTFADLEAEWERTKTVGDHAERAARSWITDQTAKCLDDARDRDAYEDACERLCTAVPGSGKTVKVLREALREHEETRDRETLARGLHVSRSWDGVGYDLLGLEERETGLKAVRYEVKSLPSEGTRFKVHLSRNQLGVYRKVHVEDHADPLYDGDWRLLGVRPDKAAVDLTSELDGLPSLLRTLQTDGYDHDGLLLYVTAAAEDD